jgi:hypothetical protein
MLLAILLLSLLLAIAAPYFRFVTGWRKHVSLSTQVQDAIESLKARQPPDVPVAQWDRAVDWTTNLIGQVYFAPNKGDPDSLQRLCKSLDGKIKGQVSLTTLQWVWEECEKAPRSGAEYAIRFRDVRLLTKEPITDDDLPKLWSLDKCLYLELNNTQVTDRGLEHLEGLSNLKHLNLQNTQVTDEGVARLRTALPDCEIFR